jgi:hypothetical protein
MDSIWSVLLVWILPSILTIYAMALDIKMRKKLDKIYFSNIYDEFESFVFFAFFPLVNLVILAIIIIAGVVERIKDIRLL